jgi:hypothetical protein
MVEIGLMDAGSIPAVLFNAPVNKHIRVEVLSLAELRSRAGDSIPSRHQRATFHHLLTLERGQLRHTVDFTTFLLKPGTWLSLRPGQVYRWHDLRQVEGTLIFFEPDVLDPTTSETAALSSPHAPTIRSPTGEDCER